MANQKQYRIYSPAPFSGSRAATGIKKPRDVNFHKGISEPVPKAVADAIVKNYDGYKAKAEAEEGEEADSGEKSGTKGNAKSSK